MSLVTRRKTLMDSLLLVGAVLAMAALLPGCSPPPEQSSQPAPQAAPQTTAPHPGMEAPVPPATEPAAPSQPSGPSATGSAHELPPAQAPVPEQPKLEPPKVEQPKPETPAGEKPAETKPAEPVMQPKAAEPAKEESKPSEAAPKTEEKPAEKAAESKPETSAAKPAGGKIDAEIASYAPAPDLAPQVDEYIKEIEDAVKSEKDFNDNKETVLRDANTLIPVSLALGLNNTDKDNKYREAAPAIWQAAQKLAAATDYAAAKTALDDLKKSLESKGDPSGLKWDDAKSASLPALMKEVPLINTKLRSAVRDERNLKRRVDKVPGYTAVIAAIAQGSILSVGQTEKPTESDKWQSFCLEMRDAAGDLSAKVKDYAQGGSPEKFKAVEAAAKALTPTSCDDCHRVFHAEEVGKTQ